MDTNQNILNLVKTTVVVKNLVIKDFGDINLHFLAHKPAEYFDFIACWLYQKDFKPLRLRNTPDSLNESIGYCFKCSLIEPIILTIFAVFYPNRDFPQTRTDSPPVRVLDVVIWSSHPFRYSFLNLLIYFILMGWPSSAAGLFCISAWRYA